jgi:hypothetical protein
VRKLPFPPSRHVHATLLLPVKLAASSALLLKIGQLIVLLIPRAAFLERFQGCSTSEDGPFLFWEVSANHSSWSPLVRRFGTKEEALKYHAILVKEARADRLQDIPENFYL